MFDRCRRSSAAGTHVKYQCDLNNLTGTFTRSKFLLTAKLVNGALVTSTPGLLYSHLSLVAPLGQGTSNKTEPSIQIWHSHSGTAHRPLKMASVLQNSLSLSMDLLPICIIAGCAWAGNAGNVCRRFQRKQLVSDPGMHHDTCVMHVPWCMSG